MLHLPLLTALIFLIYRKSAGAPLSTYFFFALAAKLAAGIAVGLLYTYYYNSGDTFLFFQDAGLLADLASHSAVDYVRILLFDQFPDDKLPERLVYEQESRSFFLIKILSVISVATSQNYWLSGLYFSLFSFWGMWQLSNALAKAFQGTSFSAPLAFLFFPSIVFWSAGVMKESLVMGMIGLLTSYWLSALLRLERWKKSQLYWQIPLSLLMLLALWKLKYYYFAVYLPCLLAGGLLLLLQRGNWLRSLWAKLFLFFLLLAAIAGITSQLHPNLKANYFLEILVQTHDTLYALSKTDNRIEYHDLKPTVGSLLQNIPLALASGLFRPFLGEGNKALQWLNGLENLFLLLLACTSLFRIWQKKGLHLSREATILTCTAGLYILTLATLLAISTPNFGTLTRYKVAFLPFMIYLLANGAGLKKESTFDSIGKVARFFTGGRKS